MIMRCWLAIIMFCWVGSGLAIANPPAGVYMFPAGGQRGTTVKVRVGGLFLHKSCSLDLVAPGITADRQLLPTKLVWFEGPLLPLPDSQQAEDYPKDLAGRIRIAANAPVSAQPWRVWTAQGVTPSQRFVVGDLPEIVEEEIEGDPVPVAVQLPVTINGRIFPREDVDIWTFAARKGQPVACEVMAARLGSPLDARLEVLDPTGRRIAENDDTFGADPLVRFKAPMDGQYQVRIQDVNYRGGQAYVYRLTLTSDPYVERVYPLGGRRGQRVAFDVTGLGVPPERVMIALPADGPTDFVHRLTVGGKPSNPFFLDLDDLPEYQDTTKPVAVPAVCNGRIGRAGAIDDWRFIARKSEVYDAELRAERLGSPLTGVLTLVDAAGKELARAEAGAGNPFDPVIHFTAPADGTYGVRVAERFRGHGGLAYAYRLRIAHPPSPDFRLRLAADAVTIPRGGQVLLKVLVDRLGSFADPIALTIEGLPVGVTAANATIAAQQGATDIALKAEIGAAIRAHRLTIRGRGKIGGRQLERTATLPAPRGAPEVDTVLAAVVLPTPFKIVGEHQMHWAPRGTVYHRHYRLERGGFTGPIEIGLSDHQMRHLQGVSGPTITVPAGASAFDYTLFLPPWMETGRTCRVCVTATGMVKDADGSEYPVSFSSVEPNEQMIVVIEPGRLGIEVDQASWVAPPGGTVSVPLRVARSRGLDGAVQVELIVPAHIRDVKGDRIRIPAGITNGTMPIHFGKDVAGPFNLPLTVRATLIDKGEPVVAEAKVEIRPSPTAHPR
jgi:hypothetical protein